MPEKPITNSSLVRVAGNIASGLLAADRTRVATMDDLQRIAKDSVAMARFIVTEVERDSPPQEPT